MGGSLLGVGEGERAVGLYGGWAIVSLLTFS